MQKKRLNSHHHMNKVKSNTIPSLKKSSKNRPHEPRSTESIASDYLTQWMGSWTFILLFAVFLFSWIAINSYILIKYLSPNPWDPYPYILLNLLLSTLAAIQAPIILMSQNRQSEKDRSKADYDYAVNRKAEREIQNMKTQLDRIEKKLK